MITPNQTLGDIAANHPAATAVFLRHRLDFCCGGRYPLAEACAAAGLDAAAVIQEIEGMGEGNGESPRWDTRPMNELIDHILTRYHEPLHHDLPVFVEAARRVERVHGDKPTCPRGLGDHLAYVDNSLRSHMGKEEQVLFPALRAGRRGQAIHMPVRMMMQEHDDHAADLRRIRELTSDMVAPPEACGTWRGLYTALTQLEIDLMEHIHLENNVLFPRALGR